MKIRRSISASMTERAFSTGRSFRRVSMISYRKGSMVACRPPETDTANSLSIIARYRREVLLDMPPPPNIFRPDGPVSRLSKTVNVKKSGSGCAGCSVGDLNVFRFTRAGYIHPFFSQLIPLQWEFQVLLFSGLGIVPYISSINLNISAVSKSPAMASTAFAGL